MWQREIDSHSIQRSSLHPCLSSTCRRAPNNHLSFHAAIMDSKIGRGLRNLLRGPVSSSSLPFFFLHWWQRWRIVPPARWATSRAPVFSRCTWFESILINRIHQQTELKRPFASVHTGCTARSLTSRGSMQRVQSFNIDTDNSDPAMLWRNRSSFNILLQVYRRLGSMTGFAGL